MNEKDLTRHLEVATTRRKVVKTGVKIAYAVPVIAATFKLTAKGALAADVWLAIQDWSCGDGDDSCAEVGGASAFGDKVVLCHATCSATNPYVAIEISINALAKHLENHQLHDPETCQEDIVDPPLDGNGNALCPGGILPVSPA